MLGMRAFAGLSRCKAHRQHCYENEADKNV